jgi:hypothetical protein
MYRNFYGTKSYPYFPHSFEISYGKPVDEQELLLAKVGVEQLPESCLPKGMKVEDHRMTVSEFGLTLFYVCSIDVQRCCLGRSCLDQFGNCESTLGADALRLYNDRPILAEEAMLRVHRGDWSRHGQEDNHSPESSAVSSSLQGGASNGCDVPR